MSSPVEPALVAAAVLWGAAAGALLPRAAYRFAVPPDRPWRAHCPRGHPLRGWLGRTPCRACERRTTPAAPPHAPARDTPGPPHAGRRDAPGPAPAPAPSAGDPPRAPSAVLLATVTALVCAALAVATGGRPETVVWLLLTPAGVLLAAVDFRVRRLPDPLTLPLAAAALALLGAAAALPGHAGDWPTALYGALALGGGYFVLFLVNPAGMGFGDVKLALGAGAVLGWYGWGTVLLGTFAGFLLGALYGGALVVARKAGRKTAIPFGPFLIAGALAGLLVGAYTA
ncbi:A24 family peptidase [Streptomyces sp. TG1A-8]|uniref:prepilin peptidase n=1 Tax=Streptomyces sp. TG1A-8 TaxID=3051385 RepID=UPI00265BE327|nr:A24 family peptidase [Streptomyces sp. TG1A-8]MDO0926310.1 A24 family peptidase [Streptomyces sp. TG1A-8]